MPRFGYSSNGNSWVSFDAREMNGLGCGILIIVAIGFVLSIISLILGVFSYLVVGMYVGIKELTTPIVDVLVIKILFLPVFWDKFVDSLNQAYLIKVILFGVTYWILNIISKKVNQKWVNIYIKVNKILIVIKILFLIVISVLSLVIGKSYFMSDEIKFENIAIIDIDSENLDSQKNYTYSEEELTESGGMPDANHKDTYSIVQWFRFINNSPQKATAYKEFYYKIDGFYFDSINALNTYKTVVSYAPIEEGYEFTNKTSFTIQFIGDNKVLREIELTPNNPVIPVEFSFNLKEKLVVKIKGDLIDDSIVTFLGTTLSRDFK